MHPLHLIVVVGVASLCAPAQQRTVDLARLRPAFAAVEDGSVRATIAIVGDQEPMLLCAGKVGQDDVTPVTLWPLGATARLLIADALAASSTAADLDALVCRLGDEAISRRMLLEGVRRLPDWFALGPVAHPPDRATLLACAEVATLADTEFRSDCRGIAELVLLESALFADRPVGWSDFLRTHLSPRGAPVDPIDVQSLDAEQRRHRVALGADGISESPAPSLRLLLSASDIATWWRWRLRETLAPWSGSRAGRDDSVPGLDEEPCWLWSAEHGPFTWSIVAYPRQRAALVELTTAATASSVRSTFEECLFGPPPPPEERFGGRYAGTSPLPDVLRATWVAQGGVVARLERRGLFRPTLRFTCDGEVFDLERRNSDGRRHQVWLSGREQGITGSLLLWRDGDGENERLRGVFERRDATSAVPRRIDFARD